MFVVLYLGLVSVQLYVAHNQRHPITHLFTVTISLQLIGNVLHLTHLLIFAYDGDGIEGIDITGNICDILSQVKE